MKKLTILVGLVIIAVTVIAANTSTSSNKEILRKEILTEVKNQTGYPEGFFTEMKNLGNQNEPQQNKDAYKLEYFENGTASFYGGKWHGRTTANGERFDTYDMTAAHKTLPFGTKVKVTNESNGKSVVVRINDRGPFVKGRIIDLSTAAFTAIEDGSKGVTKVKLEILR